MNWLKGKKTYIVALAGMCAALAALASGEIDVAQATHAILDCLLALFIRAGVAKVT